MVIGVMDAIGRGARAAAPVLELAASEQKNRALRAAAAALRARRHKILAANDRDMQEAQEEGASVPLLDRLTSRRGARRGDGARARGHRRRSPIPSAPCSPSGRGRTACASSAGGCRSA